MARETVFLVHNKQNTGILLDSGCSDHMFSDRSFFTNYSPMESSVEIADGKLVPIIGSGLIRLRNDLGSVHTFRALHVPALSHPLLSFGRLFLANCDISRTGKDSFLISDQDDNISLFSGTVQGKIFTVKASIVQPEETEGHPSREALRRMFGVVFSTLSCEACRISKSQRLPFQNQLPESKALLEFIYMDLSGKITPASKGGGLYYFKITDAFSSFKYVYILSSKSQALEKFKLFCNEVQNLHNSKIKNVVTDGGGEFCSKEFDSFYQSQGIVHHVTAPYTPQQNSIAERGNRTTSEKARALLKQASLPTSLWGKAVITAVFYENITPMKRIKWKTPYELWFDRKFDLTRLKTFGCLAYVNIPKDKRNGKFGDTAKRGILLGYRQGIRNWRILLPGNRVEFSHDVIFDETVFPGISPNSLADSSDFIPFEEEDEVALSSPPTPASTETVASSSEDDSSSDDDKVLQHELVGSQDLSGDVQTPAPPSSTRGEVPQVSEGVGASTAENPNAQQADNSDISAARPKPGYSWVPADQPPPNPISSDIDTSNILPSTRRARYANRMLTAEPFYEAIFAMAVSHSTSPLVPKSYA
ncbi:hypothetical protein PCANC_28925, partial [Puccinia coronata f. sp. avenae]